MMDHYIPKRRVAVSLRTRDAGEIEASLYLDLDPSGARHPTILNKLNERSRFLPVAIGEEGRTHLVRKSRLVRVTAGPGVLQADLYTRGFQPWREEPATLWLANGEQLDGRVWMTLERPTQRMSDFMNHVGQGFFVLLTPESTQLVNAGAVVRMALAETADAAIAERERAVAARGTPSLDISRIMPIPAFDPTHGLGDPARR